MKKKIFFTLVSFVLTAVLSLSYTEKACAQEEDGSFRLAILGDSLASGYQVGANEGYIPVLQQLFINDGLDNVMLINAAKAGDTTADGLARVDEVLAQNPHAVIVELGGNDLLRNLSIDEAQKNLETIIEKFQDNNIPVMLIGIQIPLVLDLKNREALNTIYKKLAKKYDLVLYPHFLDGVLIERFGVYDLKYMQADTVHPTAQGIQIMVQKTYPVIKKFLMNL